MESLVFTVREGVVMEFTVAVNFKLLTWSEPCRGHLKTVVSAPSDGMTSSGGVESSEVEVGAVDVSNVGVGLDHVLQVWNGLIFFSPL